MTASERLRELRFQGTEDDAELITMGHLSMLAMRDLRDLIADVVEAAENVASCLPGMHNTSLEIFHGRLAPALTALHDALEEK